MKAMLVAERLQKIIHYVNERSSVRVSELSELCGVTEETIRRDLDKLENDGKLLRSHGGAISVKESTPEIPFMERETRNMKQKKRIAQEAVAHIEPKDRIVLDASSTAWYMAKILPDIPLTVLTNSIKVAMELSTKEKIEVISTGGILSPRTLSYVGPLAERSLSLYHVDKAFLSCNGAHLQRGISESSEMQALIKQKMISLADRVYLLIDYSKFGFQSFAHVTTWSDVHHVITDAKTSPADVQSLREMEVDVIQLPEA